MVHDRIERMRKKMASLTSSLSTANLAELGLSDECPNALLLLHAITLFPSTFEPSRIEEAKPPGGRRRFSLEGVYFESYRSKPLLLSEHELFLRKGGVEFALRAPVSMQQGHTFINAQSFIQIIAGRLRSLRHFCSAALFQLPALIQLSIVDVGRTWMWDGDYMFQLSSDLNSISTEPFVLNEWNSEARVESRRMMDTIWQAYGIACAPLDLWLPWDKYVFGELK
jgi:hypothetical protein